MMRFLKSFFGESSAEDPVRKESDTLKYDGVRALRMHEYELAVRFLSEALREQGGDDEIRRFLVEAYMGCGDSAQALPLLRELTQTDPENLTQWLALARAAGDEGAWDEATQACDKVLQSDPADVTALHIKAQALHAGGDALGAVALLTQSLAQSGDFVPSRLLRARTLMEMGQYVEALKDIDTLLSAQPEDDALWVLRGDCLAAQGNEDALACYHKAVELNPFNDEAIIGEGDLYISHDQLDKALAHYDAALAERPDFAAAYKARGQVKRLLHDDEGALADLKQALEKDPSLQKHLSGDFSRMENQVENALKWNNPYGF